MTYLHRTSLLSSRVGERLFHDRLGVGRALYLILRTIADEGPQSQRAVADRFSLTKGAVSQQVATAERHGWLTIGTSKVSRREHTLALTDPGRALVDRGRALQEEQERRARAQLDPDDVATTVRTLAAMCTLIEQEDKE